MRCRDTTAPMFICGWSRMTPSRGQTIELRYKLSRMVMLFLVSVAFVAIGIWQATLDPSEIRWSGTIFFGVCALVLAHLTFDRRPQVLIGPTGLIYRKWKFEVPWSHIASVEINSSWRTKFIVLGLRNPNTYSGQGIGGRLSWILRRMGLGDIAIPIMGLDRSADDILAAIEHFLHRED